MTATQANLTETRSQFEALVGMPLADSFLRQEGQFVFAKDTNSREWSVKLTKSGKIKANSLRREF